jgi:hypothetical protein
VLGGLCHVDDKLPRLFSLSRFFGEGRYYLGDVGLCIVDVILK